MATEPWGLQPDPIGADGYLFFRAWFLLLLATHKYISGDDKWARTFKVTGYHDETFDWDMHRIAERLESQYRAHPEGPQCENTKIWVFCNTAGGLGMHLYDKVFGEEHPPRVRELHRLHARELHEDWRRREAAVDHQLLRPD